MFPLEVQIRCVDIEVTQDVHTDVVDQVAKWDMRRVIHIVTSVEQLPPDIRACKITYG